MNQVYHYIHYLKMKSFHIYNQLKDEENGYAFDIPDNIDGKVFKCISENRCIPCSFEEKHKLRERLYQFISKLKFIQHYYYYKGASSDAQIKGNI